MLKVADTFDPFLGGLDVLYAYLMCGANFASFADILTMPFLWLPYYPN